MQTASVSAHPCLSEAWTEQTFFEMPIQRLTLPLSTLNRLNTRKAVNFYNEFNLIRKDTIYGGINFIGRKPLFEQMSVLDQFRNVNRPKQTNKQSHSQQMSIILYRFPLCVKFIKLVCRLDIWPKSSVTWKQFTLSIVLQQLICQHQSHHSLNHWYCTRYYTRIMTTPRQ